MQGTRTTPPLPPQAPQEFRLLFLLCGWHYWCAELREVVPRARLPRSSPAVPQAGDLGKVPDCSMPRLPHLSNFRFELDIYTFQNNGWHVESLI